MVTDVALPELKATVTCVHVALSTLLLPRTVEPFFTPTVPFPSTHAVRLYAVFAVTVTVCWNRALDEPILADFVPECLSLVDISKRDGSPQSVLSFSKPGLEMATDSSEELSYRFASSSPCT
jgi:hypothetical protein